jgi:hypothetical protein
MTACSGDEGWDFEVENRSSAISDGVAGARRPADRHYLAVVVAEIHRLAHGLGASPMPRPPEFRKAS